MIAKAENVCQEELIADRLSMTPMELMIDPELKDLLPPLPAGEYAGLEADILKKGCLTPLFAWDSLLVDGFHRHDICTKHQIPYEVKNVVFADLDEAKLWILKHQANRRNLAPFHRAELTLKLKNIVAAKAKERQLSVLKQNTVPANLPEWTKSRETREELAEIAVMSPRSFAKAEYIATHAEEVTKEKLRLGEKGTSIDKEYKRLRSEEKSSVEPNPAQKTAAKKSKTPSKKDKSSKAGVTNSPTPESPTDQPDSSELPISGQPTERPHQLRNLYSDHLPHPRELANDLIAAFSVAEEAKIMLFRLPYAVCTAVVEDENLNQGAEALLADFLLKMASKTTGHVLIEILWATLGKLLNDEVEVREIIKLVEQKQKEKPEN